MTGEIDLFDATMIVPQAVVLIAALILFVFGAEFLFRWIRGRKDAKRKHKQRYGR